MNSLFLIPITLLVLAAIYGNGASVPPHRPPKILPKSEVGVDCICDPTDNPCRCEFKVEHLLTMIYNDSGKIWLVEPCNGYLCLRGQENQGRQLTEPEQARVITADGNVSRLVIGINGKFPGPRIDAFENQELEITVVNLLHTDTITIHFHGLHQVGRPWMDGVPYVTQCPILPGQTFVYRIKADPIGTSFYRADIADQHSMGLYGPVIVRRLQPEQGYSAEIIVTLQDWNHVMDAATAYQRMVSQQFDLGTGEPIGTTMSVDTANFSRFEFQSGLINGKGRYWMNINENNGSPLEKFVVKEGEIIRFRIIGAMTQYPMRVYIEGQSITLRGSDCYNLDARGVQSIIVHPGERYDFSFMFGSADRKQFLLIAETIETRESHGGYHAAEAIIEIGSLNGTVNPNPPNNKVICLNRTCDIFNCPFRFPGTTKENCLNFNNVSNEEKGIDPDIVKSVDDEYFFNFGFPGPHLNAPGSVNGREFVFPVSPLLTQPDKLKTQCTDVDCIESTCK